MKNLTNYLKAFIQSLIIIVILSIILTLLYNFDLISDNFYNITKMIIPIISLIIGGVYVGRRSKSKGYQEGIKASLFYIIFSVIFSLIFDNNFNLSIILYYLILMISSSFGSMLGILKQKKAT